jgi:integrase
MPRRARWKDDLDAWQQDMLQQNIPQTTMDTYSNAVRQAWRYGSGHDWPENPAKVSASHVRDYLAWLRRYPTNTQSTYGTGLLLFLRFCKNGEFERFKLRIRCERVRADWLTVEETAAAITLAPNIWTLAMVVLFAYTGLRLSELLELRMCDMHPDHISVVGKRSKGRTIPVTPQFWAALEPYMRWRREQDGLLFLVHPPKANASAGPYAESSVRNAVTRLAARMGRHLSPHTFRRSYGRHLYKAGMPLQEIARLYGHASVNTTIRYLGIVLDDLADSVNRFQPNYMG